MLINISLALFLIVSCGRKTELVEEKMPPDTATSAEQEMLDKVLTDIQKDFDQAGIEVDLHSIPYAVSHLRETLSGTCLRKLNGEPKGIALNHNLFAEHSEEKEMVSNLHHIVLHEIGHCFFKREHDDEYYFEPGHVIKVRERMSDLGLQPLGNFQQSLMQGGGFGYTTVPALLWPYYVKEIAGKARIKKWQDILEFTEAEIVPVSKN